MTEVDEVTMVKSANGMQFWACQSMQHVLTNLVSSGGFYGRIVAKQDGYILIEEESMAQQAVTLPRYLATIRRYTELECRNVFRRMVLCVGAFHDAGVAHRNLNPLNFVVEEGGVSFRGLFPYIYPFLSSITFLTVSSPSFTTSLAQRDQKYISVVFSTHNHP